MQSGAIHLAHAVYTCDEKRRLLSPKSLKPNFETDVMGVWDISDTFQHWPSIGKTEEDFALNRIPRNTFENNQPGTCAALIKTLTCVSDAELLGCLSG